MKYFRKILESWLCVLCMLATTCTSKPILANDTEINKPHSECLENNSKLVIKGYNVTISDLLNVKCMTQAKYIEVFALNKLIIDADIDKTGKEAQITLIAPIWEISGNRKIILDGKRTESKPEKLPIVRMGRPGKPGQPSGSILGIGYTFNNDKQLNIHLNGARGERGGRGGIGLKFMYEFVLINNFFSYRFTIEIQV